ncbi:MAG: hypothetical protein ACKODX_14265 [Gemmata sp.]
MPRSLLCGLLSWVVLGSPAAGRADDAEDRAVETVKKLGGGVSRDEKSPGKPVVAVMLDLEPSSKRKVMVAFNARPNPKMSPRSTWNAASAQQ